MNVHERAWLAAPCALLVCVAWAGQPNRSLFRGAGHPPSPPGYLQDRGVKRLRAVVANLALVDQKAAKEFHRSKSKALMTLQFFPDVTLKVRWTEAGQTDDLRGIVWTGSVEGAQFGHATLIVSGQALTGDVTRGDGLSYQVRTGEDGVIWVREVDQKAFPRELNPIP